MFRVQNQGAKGQTNRLEMLENSLEERLSEEA